MSFARSYTVTVVTDASGDSTDYSGGPANGRLLEVVYDGGMATGGDITFTGATTGKALLTITNGGTSNVTWRPRGVVHTQAETGAGTAVTYDGTNEIYEPVWLVDEEIKIVTANGGNVDTGIFTLIVG